MAEAAEPVGGDGRVLKALLSDKLGGPSADDVIARLGQPDLAEVKAVVSWRGVVSDPDVCSVNLALAYVDLIQEESCGRCTPCRAGTDLMREFLRRLAKGEGTVEDIDNVRKLALQIEESAWCGIANTIRDGILGLLELGGDHFVEHTKGTTCSELRTQGWMTAPCRSTCPSTVDCPSYLFQGGEEHPHLGTTIVKRDNPLPAIIGRTCPHPCEANCTLNPVGQAIAINFVKRWCADRSEGLAVDACESGRLESDAPKVDLVGASGPHELSEAVTAQESQRPIHPRFTGRGERVAVIGAGPAGLSAAYYLARLGHSPVIFEALPVPGGMVHVGIPEYRLPRHVIRREVELIEREGVEIRYNQRLGRDLSFADLPGMGFGATFIGIGAHLGRALGIPGEDLAGSIDAIEFLRRVALGEHVEIGDNVLVLGGGNSAMDAARTSVRLGAKGVRVVYRRSRDEMPANPWEVEEAIEEGVDFQFLTAPVSCQGDARVGALVCQQMELGEPDASGRRRPVPADMAPFVLAADSVIAAIGQQPDFSPFDGDADLAHNKWGFLEADPRTLATTKPGVFMGGDASSGGGTIIEAIAAGKTAAKYMDLYLRGEPVVEDLEDKTRRLAVYLGAQGSRYPLTPTVDYGQREPMPMLAPEIRKHTFAPTELGYSLSQAKAESKRCLRCHRPIIVAV